MPEHGRGDHDLRSPDRGRSLSDPRESAQRSQRSGQSELDQPGDRAELCRPHRHRQLHSGGPGRHVRLLQPDRPAGPGRARRVRAGQLEPPDRGSAAGTAEPDRRCRRGRRSGRKSALGPKRRLNGGGSLKAGEEALRRDIGFSGSAFLSFNGVVGAGIFALPETLYGQFGTFSPFLFPLFGLLIFVVALPFGRTASHHRVSGGPVVYAAVFGQAASFQAGWIYYIARATALAANTNVLVAYL